MNEKQFKNISLILITLSVVYYFYLETKKHNLDVINSIRLCASLSEDGAKSCADAVKRQKVF